MDILQQMNLTDFTLYDLINVKGVEDTIDRFPLMASPVPSTILIAIYLYFIYKWGPNYMENRKPFDLKLVIAAYNIFQVAACSYLVMSVSLPLGILNSVISKWESNFNHFSAILGSFSPRFYF
uniref:Elongation of very long chain fatty acids protein 7 n=1 Tax=Culex pipiens TaxID=7175 RepID=A0A8D8E3S5_CULPI